MDDRLRDLAALLTERNQIDARIAAVIERPAERSHIGEYIARGIFQMTEPDSASQSDSDGTSASGPLKSRSVNVKFYGKDDGIWSIKDYPSVDYYLVLTGQRASAGSSRGETRPLVIDRVFLVPERALSGQEIKPGIATSVRRSVRDPYQVFPTHGNNAVLRLTDRQREMIQLFCTTTGAWG